MEAFFVSSMFDLHYTHIDGLVKDWSISSSLAMELL